MTVPEIILSILGGAEVCLFLWRCSMGIQIGAGKRNDFFCCETGASRTIGTREVQEDEYGILESEEGTMAVLADGMGKQFGGKIASRAAVEVFRDVFQDRNAFYHPQYSFRRAFQESNREILNLLEERQGQASVAALLIKNHRLYFASVGNVKIAVYRNQELVPVNDGHTIDVLARQKYMQGKLSKQDAVSLLEHHRLYNFVGQDGFHDIEFLDTPITLRGGESILLMTDGLYDGVRWKEIEDCLEQKKTCQEKAYALIELVNQSKEEEKDNASVVILKVKG